ncbi:MAG: ferritin-like domain-containing protein [Myxococcota bacterium]
MLGKRSFFRRIVGNREAYRLLMNSLAVGEAMSAVDLDRIAEHIPDPALARKVYRHFAEERRHARLFRRRLEDLGFEVTPLPPELEYETYASEFGMGTPHARLDDPEPFSTAELIEFFSGSMAGEERACAEMEGLIASMVDDPVTVKLLETIHADEVRHVSYATEEMNRLAREGHRDQVLQALRHSRRSEARAHRLVSLAFMDRLMRLLGAPWIVRAFGALSVHIAFAVRYLFPGGLGAPRIANAMPVPAGAPGASAPDAVLSSESR